MTLIRRLSTRVALGQRRVNSPLRCDSPRARRIAANTSRRSASRSSTEVSPEEDVLIPRAATAALTVLLLLAGCGGQANERANTQSATTTTGPAATPPSLTDACGSAAGIEERPLWLETEDGVQLYAVEIGAGPIEIVLAHQAPASLCGWLPTMKALADEGFRVLAFDFRSYGHSQSQEDTDARLALGPDLAAAVARARASGAAKVFLIGASLGGAASVQASASLPVDGIVSLSGTRFYPGYGVNDPDAVRRLRAPFLFVGTRDDSDVPVEEAMDVLHQIGSSDKRTRFYPGSWHGWEIVQDAPQAAEARELVVQWVRARS